MISQITGQGAAFAVSRQPYPRAAQASSLEVAPDPVADSSQVALAHSHVANLFRATGELASKIEKSLPEHVPGQVIVKLKPDFVFAGNDIGGLLGGFAQDYGADLGHHFDVPENMRKSFNGEMVLLNLPAGISTSVAMAAMAKDGRVEYAASNDIVRVPEVVSKATSEPSAKPDGLNPELWGLHNQGQSGGTPDADIDAVEAWAVQTGKGQSASGPLIAVIDTGINYNHEALKGNFWTNPGEIPGNGKDDDGNGVIDDVHGFNAAAKSGNPLDDNDHGTHCAGTIGANGQNSKGLFGVMHRANLMGVKFLTASGSGTLADAVDSLFYASKMGARITSNSWGGGGYNQALYDALKSSPAMHIIAAGNEGSNNDSRPAYPASYDLPNVISVAASDHNDQLAGFSNWGAKTVDLAAPGVSILSATSGSSSAYKSFDGTSMATPHVSGAAGLIVSQYPEISNEELKARLFNSVDRLSQFEGRLVTGGRLNVQSALENDNVAPAAPSDLGIVTAKAGRVTVGFTATGDDGNLGTAATYTLKMSEQPIVDGEPELGQVAFDSLPSLPVKLPGPAGGQERFDIKTRLWGSDQTLYFALKVTDNVGNRSDLQTTSGTVPAARIAFEDKVDGRPGNFTPEREWAQVDAPGRGKVWTDSPRGKYRDDAESSLTSRIISLANLAGSRLIFDAKLDLETRYDNVFVEVAVPAEARNGQLLWKKAETLNGTADWATREVDLSAYDGKDVRVRFRLLADSSVGHDGISLDNILVAGGDR